MPAALNTKGETIPPNFFLSSLDKTYMALMYPPNLNGASETKEALFKYCMNTAKVPAKDQAEIIKTLRTGDVASARDDFLLSWTLSHWEDGVAVGSASQGLNLDDPPARDVDVWFRGMCVLPPDATEGPSRALNETTSGVDEPAHAVFRKAEHLWKPGSVSGVCPPHDLLREHFCRQSIMASSKMRCSGPERMNGIS
jgi:hypothetical protein